MASGLRGSPKGHHGEHFAVCTQRTQSYSAEPHETTRCKGDNPGSCFLAVTARTTARAGGRRDPTPPCGVTGTGCSDLFIGPFRKLCFSGERGHQCKKNWATHFNVAGTAVHGRLDERGERRKDHEPGLSPCRDVWMRAELEQRPIPRVASLLPRAQPLPCAMRGLLMLRRATSGRLVGRRGRTVRLTVLCCRVEHPVDLLE